MNWLRYLRRKGIISIAWGISVIIIMIIASYYGRSRDPIKTYEDYRLITPYNPILRSLTLWGKKIEVYKDDNFLDGDEDLLFEEDFLTPLNMENQMVAGESRDYNKKVQKKFIFGTDYYGKDVFVRVVAAANTYLVPCFLAVMIALLLGCILGIFSGYFVDSWLGSLGKGIQDSIRSIPLFVGIIIVMAATKIDIHVIMISFGVLVAPRIGTIIEQQIYSLRQHDFIIAAIEMGIPTSSIIVKHILFYNCLPLLIAQAAFTYAEAVLIETSLSFIGSGALGEDLSWGYMVKEGLFLFVNGNLWPSLFPTFAIIISIVSFQSLGNGLIKLFDYKSRRII